MAVTPSNSGKVTDAALSDADSLGVNQNVTIGEVGGFDERKSLPHNIFLIHTDNHYQTSTR